MSCFYQNYSNINYIYNKCPDEFIQSFCSYPIENDFEWTCAKFSPHPQQENIFVLGNENGSIGLFNTNEAYNNYKLIKKGTPSIDSVILDFCFLPKLQNWLVALSGCSKIFIIDLTNGKPLYYLSGHSSSVKCVSVWPDNPYFLVSGSRDGSILGWDLRSYPSEQINSKGSCLTPSRIYAFAHETPNRDASASKRPKTVSSITSLLHFGENYVISSSYASSGIKIWDLRYITGGEIRTLKIPQFGEKESGITSMCWDRFNSSFFASCTDNKIYEYLPSCSNDFPIHHLNNPGIKSYYVQCSTSPISDHLICGSSLNKAFIFDLQENRKYRQDKFKNSQINYLPNPKYSLNGYDNEFDCIQWSQNGKYFLTLGKDYLRLWSSRKHFKVENKYLKNQFNSIEYSKNFNFPTLLTSNELIQTPIATSNDTLKINIVDGRSTPQLKNKIFNKSKFLSNLPSLYFSKAETCILSNQQPSTLRTPKKLVLKGNKMFTPACKINRIEGNENQQNRTPGKSRNLTSAFLKTPGSSGKKRRRPSPISSNRSKNIKRLQKQNNNDNNKDDSPKTPKGILKYLSPLENKKK